MNLGYTIQSLTVPSWGGRRLQPLTALRPRCSQVSGTSFSLPSAWGWGWAWSPEAYQAPQQSKPRELAWPHNHKDTASLWRWTPGSWELTCAALHFTQPGGPPPALLDWQGAWSFCSPPVAGLGAAPYPPFPAGPSPPRLGV